MIAVQGGKHRGRMETVVDILGLMPCRKSHLMFGGRLTYQKMQEYLDIMVGKNLCEFREAEKMYFRTERGNAFL
jgi:predicted transcriptional regulator